MSLDKLVPIDNLEEARLNNTKVYIHNEHRFVLPILRECQLNGDLPMPCNLILLDAHPDSSPFNNENGINATDNSLSQSEFIDICDQSLAKDDGNWVIAGFETGLIKDILIFGVNRDYQSFNDDLYRDRLGGVHKIFIFQGFPVDELHSRGWLIDIPKMGENQSKMDIIEWGLQKGTGFNFLNQNKNLALVIDLDCFTIDWKDELISWPNEFFEAKFIKEKGSLSWSGSKFIKALLPKLGTITIAKEPDYCGDMETSNKILNQVNKYVFKDKLLFNI
ncbi:MAG: hypothetical protein GWP19_11160 [Planctomycetia bacterium]|nr:hypothetical protein [Planctomycetia bacterium]